MNPDNEGGAILFMFIMSRMGLTLDHFIRAYPDCTIVQIQELEQWLEGQNQLYSNDELEAIKAKFITWIESRQVEGWQS